MFVSWCAVFSVGIVAVVGLAAVLYARRRWPRVQLRDVSQCLQHSMKQSGGKSSVRAASKSGKKLQETGGDWKSRTSDMDMHTDSALDREMDELESDGCVRGCECDNAVSEGGLTVSSHTDRLDG